MEVDHEIVVWTKGQLAPLIYASDLGGFAPLTHVEGEAVFRHMLPPEHNPRAYFIDLAVMPDVSASLSAVLAGRPLAWPPVILFGADGTALRAVPFTLNSRIHVTPQNVVEQLTAAASYWVNRNQPLL